MSYISRLIYIFAVILPLSAVTYAIVEYKNVTDREIKQLEEKIGNVAGAETKSEVNEISSKDLPIMPNTDIVSIDVQNKDKSIVLQTEKPDSETKNFYDDYLFQNGWILNEDQTKYTKENETLEITINEGVIKITISKN